MALTGAGLTLSKSALFKGFSETGILILASIAAERLLASGAPLFVEGMTADAFFVVKAGTIRVSLKGPSGDQTVGFLGVGETLGQLVLLGVQGARLVSAVADGAIEIIEIRQRDFLRLQAEKPQACLKLMMAIAAQMGEFMGVNRDMLRAAALAR